LHAFDKQGQEMLPRPSKEYRIMVSPRFYAEPEHIDFGNISPGKVKGSNIRIYSGLTKSTLVTIQSAITKASRCQDKKYAVPYIQINPVIINPGQVLDQQIQLKAPENGCWGYFDGEIFLKTDNGDIFKIDFSTHVPSIWEKLTWTAIFLLLILLIIFCAFVIIWANLKPPTGVLRAVKGPVGSPVDDFNLSRVRRGFFSRWIHWKKNIVTIGSRNTHVCLDNLHADMRIELIFYRFLGDFIKNVSRKDSGQLFTVNMPDLDIDIDREPGKSYRLINGLRIKIGDYEFVYENI
jgi:hypothetical protein